MRYARYDLVYRDSVQGIKRMASVCTSWGGMQEDMGLSRQGAPHTKRARGNLGHDITLRICHFHHNTNERGSGWAGLVTHSTLLLCVRPPCRRTSTTSSPLQPPATPHSGDSSSPTKQTATPRMTPTCPESCAHTTRKKAGPSRHGCLQTPKLHKPHPRNSCLRPAANPHSSRWVAGGGLSDLWDGPQQPPQQQQPQSLRRGPGRGAPAMSYQGRPGLNNRLSPEPQALGRPLPSQRAGSYQSSFAAAEPSPPPSAGSGSTAQERLKARLWGGGRSTSPSQSQATSANTSPAAAPGAGGFQDRTRGPGGGTRPPYPDQRSSGASAGGVRQQQQQQQQQSSYSMSASAAPGWDYDPYAPDNYSGAPQPQPPRGGGGRLGLPSGPRMR